MAVNTRRACFVALTAISLLAGAVAGAAAEEGEPPAEPLPERVLFVGNSHTARNGGLEWHIEKFVSAEDPMRAFEGEAMTHGGVTLAYHWQNGTRDRIRTGHFDAVVLQGYLAGAETRTAEPFLEHARLLHEAVRESGAKTVLFMTWPRGFDDWSDMTDVIEAHRTLEAELGVSVAPAAYAFELAKAERPDLELISEDEVHASWDGAYLAAATVYATLFDRSPEGLPYSLGIEPDDAAFLQRIAWQALREWREGADLAAAG